MKNISVITVVYNEERRIESFCKSFSWSDDLIIINKSSTDKTREIALKYTNKVIDVPYSDTGDELKLALEASKNEWILMVTASNIIHPELVKDILKLLNKENFDYEVIMLPFAIYMFGINNDKSPWNVKYTNRLAKKSNIVLGNKVHEEYSVDSKKIYYMSYDSEKVLYHLTHETLEWFLERHIRYARAEKEKYEERDKALKLCFKELIFSILKVIKKRTFFKGWDGLALSLAYISYFIMKYLFVWEKFNGIGTEKYKNIRKMNEKLWNNYFEEEEKKC